MYALASIIAALALPLGAVGDGFLVPWADPSCSRSGPEAGLCTPPVAQRDSGVSGPLGQSYYEWVQRP